MLRFIEGIGVVSAWLLLAYGFIWSLYGIGAGLEFIAKRIFRLSKRQTSLPTSR